MVADVIDRFVLHMNGPEHLLALGAVWAQGVHWIGQATKWPSRSLLRLSIFFLLVSRSICRSLVVGRRAHPPQGHGDQHKQTDEQKEQQGQGRRDKAEEADGIGDLA